MIGAFFFKNKMNSVLETHPAASLHIQLLPHTKLYLSIYLTIEIDKPLFSPKPFQGPARPTGGTDSFWWWGGG